MTQILIAAAVTALLFTVQGLLGNRGCNGQCAGCAGDHCDRPEVEGDRHVR